MSSEGKDIINQRTELFLAIILKTNVSACNFVQSFLGWEFWRQRCPESTFKTHYSLGVTSSMLPELQQNTVCIGATAIPPYPTATGTSATGVRRTEWNQTEAGEEKFPRPLNHQTQTRLQPLRPPVHNPLSQTQTRPQPLRPPVHNPLSQTQTRLQPLRPRVHNPLSQTQTRPQPLRPPVHNPLSQTQTRPQPLRPPVHNPLSQTQTRPQPLRPRVHNPLSQTQTRPQPLRPPVHNPLSQTQTPTPKTSSDQPKP
ncbi:uncharacterized protein ACWYII_032112 [Salvelinus alpinus]|uniref:uncharacterized protein n=1 Tax=Salvelinus alpinus TaxID=8036 RepID=UPI0039FD14C2